MAEATQPGHRRQHFVIASLLIAVGLLAYANSLSNPFVFDDLRSVQQNFQIRALWPLSTPLSPPDETPVARRPLVNLSLAINYAAGGLDVRGFRLGNLTVHLVAALVLFGLVRRTLTLDSLAPRFGRHAAALAGISAILWTLHPLQTEVVNYISQRTSSMMGLFYLLTLYCSVRGVDPHARGWRVASVLSCAAGMACKESMATAPVLLMLFDRVFVFASFREMLSRRGSMYAGLAATWIVLGALMASGARTTVGFNSGVSSTAYLLNQLPILVTYLRLVVWPRDLVVDYGAPVPMTLEDVAGPAVIVVALAVLAATALRYRPAAGFLMTTFFVALAPTSSIVPIVTEVGAERRMYLPLAAIIVLAVCGVYRIWGATVAAIQARHPGSAHLVKQSGRRVALIASCAMAAALVAGTILRNRDYHSDLTLAKTMVERRPHGRAYFALGTALTAAGQHAAATPYFRKSARDFPPAHLALGLGLLDNGHMDEGINELRTFVRLMPNHMSAASARRLLATSLAAQGRFDEAMTEIRKVLELEPQSGPAHGLLGDVLIAKGRANEAVAHLEHSLRLAPGDGQTLKSLARAYSMVDNDASAVALLERGVLLYPNDPEMYSFLGTALARSNRLREALAQFRRAAELDPGSETVRANLAEAQRQVPGASQWP
jgi:Flp pilus assembly protein TadD